MVTNWLFKWLIPGWHDLITNPLTGKVSGKNLFGAVGYVVGIGLACVAVGADIYEHRQVNNTTILLLIANGLGLVTAKIVQSYLNRKTKDEDGPLVQPQPPAPPTEPQLMPQAEPPAAIVLAGYNDGLGSTTHP